MARECCGGCGGVTMATMTCGEGDRVCACPVPGAGGGEALGCPRSGGGRLGVHGAPALVREDGHHAVLCPCQACGHPDDE